MSRVKGKVSSGPTVPSNGPRAPEQKVKRMREALALCQGYCGYTAAEPLTDETWALLPLEDLSRGGSVHLHYRRTSKTRPPTLVHLDLECFHLLKRCSVFIAKSNTHILHGFTGGGQSTEVQLKGIVSERCV